MGHTTSREALHTRCYQRERGAVMCVGKPSQSQIAVYTMMATTASALVMVHSHYVEGRLVRKLAGIAPRVPVSNYSPAVCS